MNLLEADSPCPHDSAFVHRFYFGCVPADFSPRTGRSKIRSQTQVDFEGFGRWLWNGGCDAIVEQFGK